MPYYRKKICASPNCKNYAESNSAYCSEHKKEVFRGTTSKYESWYKTAWWMKARKNFLLSNIWCEECLKEGKYTPADLVHHTQGYNSWETFCDISKWEAICKSCHSKIHITETNESLFNKYHRQ